MYLTRSALVKYDRTEVYQIHIFYCKDFYLICRRCFCVRL